MKIDNKTKYAYAAGLLDGEGCIRIGKRLPRNGRSTAYNLNVQISQKDGKMIDWLYGNFGGVVYLQRKHNDTTWIYVWIVTDIKAFDFLKKVLPFMIYKKPQAELAIRFQQRRIFEHKRTNGEKGRYTSLTESELCEREKIYQEMSKMKKAFVKSKNPNVVDYTLKTMVQE